MNPCLGGGKKERLLSLVCECISGGKEEVVTSFPSL